MKTKILLSAVLICMAITMQSQWTYTNLSEAKAQMGCTSLGSKAYFAGGANASGTFLSDVEIYDLENETWSYSDLSVARQFPAGVSCGSKVFFAGGIRMFSNGTNEMCDEVDIYDTVTNEWTVAYLSEPRFSISAVAKGNKVLFAGGINLVNNTATSVVDIYDMESDSWTTASLSEGRGSMGSAIIGDLVFFAGGYNLVNYTNKVDIYDFTEDSWSTATLSQARGFIAATTVGNNVLFAGGMTDPVNSNSTTKLVDVYNIATDSWTTDQLSYPRAFFDDWGATVNSKAFFVGGGRFFNGSWYSCINVVDIYDDVTGLWSTDEVTHNIINHSVTAADNSLLVAGGQQAQYTYSTVEIYTSPTLIHVPADYPTIQQGIEAAGLGDTVLVADGLYYENINFLGKKPLMVASEFLLDGDTSHIANTIIDGSQPEDPDLGSVVTFESGEDTTSVLCGFTITGGTGTVESSVNMRMGGGLHIKFSGGKFLNNHIHSNSVSYSGGVYGGGMQLGGPITEIPWIVLRGNRINNNVAKSSAEAASGGGFFCFYNLIMEYNEISHNEAIGYLGGDGAGAAIGGAFGLIQVDVHDNIVMYNEAKTDIGTNNYATLGGGMSFYWDITGNVSYNVITDNSLEAPGTYWSFGAGVFVQDITSKDFIFENNLIEDNLATTEKCFGGGLSLLRSVGTYQNNVLINNTASHGGGLSAVKEEKESGIPALISNTTPGEGFSTKNGEKDGDIPILFNNTITGNEANNGNGIYLQSVANAFVMNSIIWGNFPPGGDNIKLVNSNIEVRYCDVELIDGGIWPGEGNINEEPQFQSDGYHLDYPSALLNMGVSSTVINEITYQAPLYDIDGEVRPFASTQPDIGADEAQWNYVSVNESAFSSSYIKIYPNPVRYQLLVDFELDKEATVSIELYNTTGTLVQSITPQTNSTGKHQLELNTANLQPGIYFIRLQAGNQIATKKVVKL